MTQIKTDLDKVKDIAINFLYIGPEPTCPEKFGNLFVSHPYLNSEITILPSTKEMVYIFNQPELFNKWRQEMTGFIRDKKDVASILILILPPYKISFFKYICDDLSEKDFATTLRHCYESTEFPSNDVNVSKKTMLRWFQKANKKLLMNNEERKYLDALPETVTIYRGVCSKKYRDGLSWTLDIDQAGWFARRFSYDGETPAVYKCNVPKSAILAYWDNSEKEVILDYNYLKNSEMKEFELVKNES